MYQNEGVLVSLELMQSIAACDTGYFRPPALGFFLGCFRSHEARDRGVDQEIDSKKFEFHGPEQQSAPLGGERGS